MTSNKPTNNSMPIRQALRYIMRKYAMAKDTGNRPLQAQCRGFLREYLPKRNRPLHVILTP